MLKQSPGFHQGGWDYVQKTMIEVLAAKDTQVVSLAEQKQQPQGAYIKDYNQIAI